MIELYFQNNMRLSYWIAAIAYCNKLPESSIDWFFKIK